MASSCDVCHNKLGFFSGLKDVKNQLPAEQQAGIAHLCQNCAREIEITCSACGFKWHFDLERSVLRCPQCKEKEVALKAEQLIQEEDTAIQNLIEQHKSDWIEEKHDEFEDSHEYKLTLGVWQWKIGETTAKLILKLEGWKKTPGHFSSIALALDTSPGYPNQLDRLAGLAFKHNNEVFLTLPPYTYTVENRSLSGVPLGSTEMAQYVVMSSDLSAILRQRGDIQAQLTECDVNWKPAQTWAVNVGGIDTRARMKLWSDRICSGAEIPYKDRIRATVLHASGDGKKISMWTNFVIERKWTTTIILSFWARQSVEERLFGITLQSQGEPMLAIDMAKQFILKVGEHVSRSTQIQECEQGSGATLFVMDDSILEAIAGTQQDEIAMRIPLHEENYDIHVGVKRILDIAKLWTKYWDISKG